MNARIVIDVDRDGWTQNLQLNIATLDDNDRGMGYRLAGPKCNGSSTNLLRTQLDDRDAAEIRATLDTAFPLPAAPTPAEVLHQAARLMEAAGYSDDAVNWLDTYADYDPAGAAETGAGLSGLFERLGPPARPVEPDAIEYGIRLAPDAPDSEVHGYQRTRRIDVEDRLKQNRARHPNAQLVQRTVHHSQWTVAFSS